MHEESVARRYAAALFALAEKNGTVDQTGVEMKTVVDKVHDTRFFDAILHQPLLSEQRKKDALLAAFGNTLSPVTLGFLNLLADKRRIDMLSDIEDEFARLVREKQHIEIAQAVSAVALTPAEVAALTRSLEARTGKKISLTARVDPDVIGGVLVKIGDTVFDGTVRGNLERLREQMLTRR